MSIERDVFPRLADEGERARDRARGLLARRRDARVVPAGAPRRARALVLRPESRRRARAGLHLVDQSAEVHLDARLVPPVYVGPGAVVEVGARAGSLAVVGAGARLGRGAVVENAVIGAGAADGRRHGRRWIDRRRRRRSRAGLRGQEPGGRRPGRPLGRGERARPRAPHRRGPARSRQGAPAFVSERRRPHVEPRRVDKPWGWELVWAETEAYVGKPLRAGGRVAEPPVPRGQGRVVARARGPRAARARRVGRRGSRPRRSGRAGVPLPAGTVHRVTALEDTLVLEVSTPHLDDVVRLEDRYGREGSEP